MPPGEVDWGLEVEGEACKVPRDQEVTRTARTSHPTLGAPVGASEGEPGGKGPDHSRPRGMRAPGGAGGVLTPRLGRLRGQSSVCFLPGQPGGSSAGAALWDPLSASQLEAQQCAWEAFHIRVQHHTVGRREGQGWRGSSQTCGPLRSALRAVTHEGVSPHVLKGAQLLPWTELGPGRLWGAGHWWFLMYRVASLSAAWPSEVKQGSPRPPL